MIPRKPKEEKKQPVLEQERKGQPALYQAVRFGAQQQGIRLSYDPHWETKYKMWAEQRRRQILDEYKRSREDFLKWMENEVPKLIEQSKKYPETQKYYKYQYSKRSTADWEGYENEVRRRLYQVDEENKRVYAELKRLMDTALKEKRTATDKSDGVWSYLKTAQERLEKERKQKEDEEFEQWLRESRRERTKNRILYTFEEMTKKMSEAFRRLGGGKP